VHQAATQQPVTRAFTNIPEALKVGRQICLDPS